MTKIVSIANNKGGVGKTTSNILLACRLREQDKKVLLIDLEFPGYLSRFFNQHTSLSNDPAVMSLFRDKVKPPLKISENLSLYQCFDELAVVDSMGIDAVMNFKTNLESIKGDYDYIIIDTPPLLNNRLDCSLNACNRVICVVKPDSYSVDGMGSFLSRYNRTRSFSNHSLPKKPFVFFNMVMGTNKEHKILMDEFFKVYPAEFTTPNYLKNRKAISDSIDLGLPVWRSNAKKFIKDEALAVFDTIIKHIEED